MVAISNNPLILVTQENVKKVREFYGMTDPITIQNCLVTITEWYQKQDHLVEACKHLDTNVLERIFLLSRFSTEATKLKIDKLFTSRGLVTEMFHNRTMDEFNALLSSVNYVPLPKLTPDLSRVMVTQFKAENIDDFNILSYFRYAFLLGEYRLHYDYPVSEHYILDMKNVHLGFLGKLNPVVLKKADILCIEAFGTKIRGIHILNAPSFVDKILFLLKQALREKVASRIHVHRSYESLQEHIPKHILPEEYGGESESCAKLQEKWKEALNSKEGQRIMEQLEHFVSDESQRKDSSFNVEYLGMPGSFRKLSVD